MTICVAGICRALPPQENFFCVIGAADRMLTSGDIEFEPEKAKIVPITAAVYALLAGDSGLHSEILAVVLPIVNERIAAEPNNWWNVREVAELYSHHYGQIIAKRAEAEVLWPLGLTLNSFLERQRTLDADVVQLITTQLQNYGLQSPVAAIICGIDTKGAHIFICNGSSLSCRDNVGFAAIGAGDWHANSQFMFAKHTWMKGFSETLFLTYSAKKRAEVAPGVGSATDMMVIGPLLGNHIRQLGNHVIEKLENLYQETIQSNNEVQNKANERVTTFINKIVATTTEAPQSAGEAKPALNLPAPQPEQPPSPKEKKD